MSEIITPFYVPMSRSVIRFRPEGSDSLRKLKSLNRQFERDILQLEESTASMEPPDKRLAYQWISKLKSRPPNLVEAHARNTIVNYLLQLANMQMFKRKPFSKPPPTNCFSDIKGMMPSTRCNKRIINQLYHDSADAKAFLDELPVPRDGAFFVIHLQANFN